MRTYPEHVGILEMALRVTLLSVDKVREFGRVADEEHGSVVEHPIPVALVCPQFKSESSWIAGGVCGAALTPNG